MLKFSGCPCLNSGRMVVSGVSVTVTDRFLLASSGSRASSGMRSFLAKGSPTRLLFPWMRVHAQASVLQRTRSLQDRDSQVRRHFPIGSRARRVKPTLRQAYSRPEPRVQFAFKDSMIHIICNSHYVSHFAAFFIDTGAKISVVESCLWFGWRRPAWRARRSLQAGWFWICLGVWASRVIGER